MIRRETREGQACVCPPASTSSIASRSVSAWSFLCPYCAVFGRPRFGGTLAVSLLLLLLLLPLLLLRLRNMGSLLHHLEGLDEAFVLRPTQAQITHRLDKDSTRTKPVDGGYVFRAVDESKANDYRGMLAEAGGETVRSSRMAVANGNYQCDVEVSRIPFFGNGDTESMRGVASHLDHRVEEYRQELVKVMQVWCGWASLGPACAFFGSGLVTVGHCSVVIWHDVVVGHRCGNLNKSWFLHCIKIKIRTLQL